MPNLFKKYNLKTIRPAGFTLIELMIAISVIAIFTTVGFSSYNSAQMRSRDAKRKQDLQEIAVALELYKIKNGRYPYSPAGQWFFSTGATGFWINDNPPSGTTIPLDGSYIKSMPIDPVNTGIYNYGYWNIPNADFNGCEPGSYFLLVAYLENANDSERYFNKPYYVGNQPIWGGACTPGSDRCKAYVVTGGCL